MSESNSGSMLLPLGLGAAGIILYMAMKKKQATENTAPAEDAAAMLPPSAEVETAPNQIVPTPAPSYTQAVIQTASEEEEQEDTEGANEQEHSERENGAEDYEEGDDNPASSSGSSYTPYTPVSTINPDQQQTASMPAIQITRNPARMIGNGKPGMKSAVLLKKQQEFNRLKKGMRFQSDQAKRLAQQQYVGNGKPKMTNTYRPGAIPASLIATKNVATLTPVVTKVAQSSIFPLKYGMTNNPYVKELQRKIGVSPTGHFNSQTRTALQRKYKVQEVSEPLYKQIITGKVPAAAKKPIPKLLSKIKKILPKRKNVKQK